MFVLGCLTFFGCENSSNTDHIQFEVSNLDSTVPTNPNIKIVWEIVCSGKETEPGTTTKGEHITRRIKVPKGWLYRTTTYTYGHMNENLVFVPD